MKKLDKKTIGIILSLDLSDLKHSIGDPGNLPDIFDLYSELINEGDIDDVIERAHILYSFCTILAAEFEEFAEITQIDLDVWYGNKWHKLKSSTTRKYTDSDAKFKINTKSHLVKEKKKIALYKKLATQLRFGGAKALEMKIFSLNSMVNRERKFEKDGFIGTESEEISKKIKSRLKRRK